MDSEPSAKRQRRDEDGAPAPVADATARGLLGVNVFLCGAAALASLGVLRPLGAAIYASLVMLQTVGDEMTRRRNPKVTATFDLEQAVRVVDGVADLLGAPGGMNRTVTVQLAGRTGLQEVLQGLR